MNPLQALCTGDAQLVPAELRGYRMWRLRGRELVATNSFNGPWDVEMTAVCRRLSFAAASSEPVTEHDAPHDGCGCGIYGWYRPDSTRLHRGDVFGVVAASGRVLLGDHGFRAERARILGIVIDVEREPYLLPVAEHWLLERRVPVFARRQDLVDAFPPEDVSELLGRPMPADELTAGLDVTTWRGHPVFSLSANGALQFAGVRAGQPPVPGSMAAAMDDFAKSMQQLGQICAMEGERIARAFADLIRATQPRYSKLRRPRPFLEPAVTEVMRVALERRRQGHRGPQRRRRGRARLEGTS